MNNHLQESHEGILWSHLIRPYLFHKDPEDAHKFVIGWLTWMQEKNLLQPLRLLSGKPIEAPVEIFGTTWRNHVGLPAGFDKGARAIAAWQKIGFGSAEIGTVTPRPQDGNPKPRIFRNTERKSLLNRMGFNSEGALKVAERLEKTFLNHEIVIPVGVSIGKNKDTPDTIDDIVSDYIAAYGAFAHILRPRDWVQTNISSPNTPGLRAIFDHLDEFMDKFMNGVEKIPRWPAKRFVMKLPPDMAECDLERAVRTTAQYKFAGVEVANTTIDEWVKKDLGWQGELGGVSGEALRTKATEVLGHASYIVQRLSLKLDIVGVGGISRGYHALEKKAAGAKGIQIFTGLIYRGPALIREVARAMQTPVPKDMQKRYEPLFT